MGSDLKSVFEQVGDMGPYQFFICVIATTSMISCSFTALSVVFQAGVDEHWCDVPVLHSLNVTSEQIKAASVPQNDDDSYEECKMYDYDYGNWTEEDVLEYSENGHNGNVSKVSCQYGWKYDLSVYGNTTGTKWNFVCDRRWWQSSAESLYAIGMLVAAPIFGQLSDMFGRTRILLFTVLPHIAINFITIFCSSYQFYIVLRFLSGFFATQMYIESFIIAAEIIGPRWRPHVNSCFGYVWSSAAIAMAGIAYLVKDWQILQIVLSFLMLHVLLYFYMPESPRWLYTQNKLEEAERIFKKVAKSNKKKNTDISLDNIFNLDDSFPVRKVSVLDLFRPKRTAFKTVVVCCNWFAASLCYYGLTFNSTSLGGNVYISFVLSVAVELPGNIFGHLVTVHIGRKWPLVFGMVSSGALLLLALFLSEGSAAMITFVSLGKMMVTLSFNLLYVYTAELYPTVIRSLACSSGNFWARVGAVIAPYIAQLSDLWQPLPLIIFGACSICSGVAAFTLVETKDIFMADSLDSSSSSDSESRKSAENNCDSSSDNDISHL